MTQLHWRPYEVGDEQALHANKWVDRYGDEGWKSLRSNLRNGAHIIAYTFLDEGDHIHGVGGFVPLNGSNAEVFAVINTESLALLQIPKVVRECLHENQEALKLRRAYATCRADDREELSGWFEYLGMEYEAHIEGWDVGGADVHFYKRILRGDSWA